MKTNIKNKGGRPKDIAGIEETKKLLNKRTKELILGPTEAALLLTNRLKRKVDRKQVRRWVEYIKVGQNA